MACMEHRCTNVNCDWVDFTNTTIKVCPKCGAPAISHFDEAGDRPTHDVDDRVADIDPEGD